MPFEAPDYAASLRVCVQGYCGAHQKVILLTPEVFLFYSRLFTSDRLPESLRPLVNGVLAYFVVPQDVMPEEDLGPYGLLDDLFLASHVYRLIRRSDVPRDLLSWAWQGEGDLDHVMAEIYTESRSVLGKNKRAVLRMAGL